MAHPRPDGERTVAEREAEARAADRAERRYWIVTLLVCLAWCAVGAFVTALGFAMVLPEETARVLIDSGQGIALGGVLLTVVHAGYHRRRRGYE